MHVYYLVNASVRLFARTFVHLSACSFVCPMFACVNALYVYTSKRLDIISPLTKSHHFLQWSETKQNIKAPMIIRDVECHSMR